IDAHSGITNNLPRVLPEAAAARVRLGSWPVLPIFRLLQRLGSIAEDEMLSTFNMGIGMILVVSEADVEVVRNELDVTGCVSHVIGAIVEGKREVLYERA
ncbi:MAG: AIR synthase-related protein, partial [Chloroflexi bacterium]|nr:AIR synthase-related protein [Chloroflexota bacterium]